MNCGFIKPWSLIHSIFMYHNQSPLFRLLDKLRKNGEHTIWKRLMGTKELRNRDPNFNEIGTPPRNFFFRKCYKLCFLLKKHLILVKKKYVTDLGGTPSPPLRTKFSAERGLRIWGVHPLPFTDKIRKVVVVVAIFYLSDMGEDCNILSHFINIGVHSWLPWP